MCLTFNGYVLFEFLLSDRKRGMVQRANKHYTTFLWEKQEMKTRERERGEMVHVSIKVSIGLWLNTMITG